MTGAFGPQPEDQGLAQDEQLVLLHPLPPLDVQQRAWEIRAQREAEGEKQR